MEDWKAIRKIDWKVIREIESGKFLVERTYRFVINIDNHDIPDPRHHYAPNWAIGGEYQCVHCGVMTGSAEYTACIDKE